MLGTLPPDAGTIDILAPHGASLFAETDMQRLAMPCPFA